MIIALTVSAALNIILGIGLLFTNLLLKEVIRRWVRDTTKIKPAEGHGTNGGQNEK